MLCLVFKCTTFIVMNSFYSILINFCLGSYSKVLRLNRKKLRYSKLFIYAPMSGQKPKK